MTLRADIAGLPPDAIAQVRRAYDDAWNFVWDTNRGQPDRYDLAHAAGCEAFREALAAVLPQEAGAPPTIRVGEPEDEIVCGDFHMERMSERHIWFAVGGETFDLTSMRPIHWKRQSGEWERMRLTHGPMGTSRAPSEAAPRLNDETLGAIEAAIIETMGDGELAAYVVRYLEAGAASRPEGDGAP